MIQRDFEKKNNCDVAIAERGVCIAKDKTV